MRLLDVVIAGVVVGCGAGPNEAAPVGAGSAPAPAAPVAYASPSARAIAVVRADRAWEECSNAGGEHVSFQIDGAGRARYAHAGGHSQGVGIGRGVSLPHQLPPQWFVAELELADMQPFSNPGWCLDNMPRFEATVLHLWPAADRDEAYILASFAGAATAVLQPAASTASVTMARVRSVDTYPKLVVHTDALDGPAPATFEVPPPTVDNPFHVGFGDLLVIASDARGIPTRVLLARDRTDAARRAAAIRSSGWRDLPPVKFASWSADRFEPSSTLGEVTPGRPKCGQDVVIAPAANAHDTVLRHAAAPPGAAVGETLSVVVEWQPPDACGRDLRVLRAYRFATGASGTKPAGSPTPLLE